MTLPTLRAAAVAMSLAAVSPVVAPAQETLERTPNLPGGWIGQNGFLHADLHYRLVRQEGGDRELTGLPTFGFGLGLPRKSLIGARFAAQSPTVAGRPSEWEVFVRHQPLTEAQARTFEVALSGGFNGAARSVDGELALARWMGPVRLLGAARAMSDGYGGGDARFAIAGGAVFHPFAGRSPIALAADAGSLLDREPGERAAWSAAVQLGISFTSHTLALFATNTSTSTLQGLSRGDDRVRYGFELTIPVPAGRFVGWYVPREEAGPAVVGEPERVLRIVRADIARYAYSPRRIEIVAGTVIEWTNSDEPVHTVTAEDGSWDSGAIATGESWRARFDRPGTYPFLCSPHPFMKGVVVVR